MSSEICYKESFVAYLDVLGFKKLVASGNLITIQTYFNVISEELASINRDYKVDSIIISDSVILTMIPEKLNEIERLRQLCIVIGKIQRRLAFENIWFRGAISYGDVYINNQAKQIVGPAYIQAFLLEQEYALYPRVILDPKIVSLIENGDAMDFINIINSSDYKNKGINECGDRVLFNWYDSNVSAKTSLIQDVPFFIDYLYPFIVNKDFKSLVKIVSNISLNIYNDVSIYRKHRWLVNYIKEICSKYSEGSEVSTNMYLFLNGL